MIREMESMSDDELFEISMRKTRKNIATKEALTAQEILAKRQNSCFMTNPLEELSDFFYEQAT